MFGAFFDFHHNRQIQSSEKTKNEIIYRLHVVVIVVAMNDLNARITKHTAPDTTQRERDECIETNKNT